MKMSTRNGHQVQTIKDMNGETVGVGTSLTIIHEDDPSDIQECTTVELKNGIIGAVLHLYVLHLYPPTHSMLFH